MARFTVDLNGNELTLDCEVVVYDSFLPNAFYADGI